MNFGFCPPFAPAPVLPQINIFANKTNGVLGNGTATAGAVSRWNSNINFKSNGMHRVSGDAAFTPVWVAITTDTDFIDNPSPQIQPRLWY